MWGTLQVADRKGAGVNLQHAQPSPAQPSTALLPRQSSPVAVALVPHDLPRTEQHSLAVQALPPPHTAAGGAGRQAGCAVLGHVEVGVHCRMQRGAVQGGWNPVLLPRFSTPLPINQPAFSSHCHPAQPRAKQPTASAPAGATLLPPGCRPAWFEVQRLAGGRRRPPAAPGKGCPRPAAQEWGWGLRCGSSEAARS